MRALVLVDIGPELSGRGREVIAGFVNANEAFDNLEHFRLARITAMGATALSWFVISEFLARSRRFDTRMALRDGAAGVARVLQPKLIVFGHSHKPEMARTSSGAYLNIGSWISRAALLGESEWGMTFAWVNPPGKPSGLYRWLGTQRDAALVEGVDAVERAANSA